MLTLNGRREISAPRDKLLKALNENLAKHKREYDIAMRDYHKAIKHELQKTLAAVKSLKVSELEKLRELTVDFDIPQLHVKDYLDAISILEFTETETILIDQEAFEAWVNNNWRWTGSFLSNSTKWRGISGAIG